MKRLWQVLAARPVETVVGLLLIVVGSLGATGPHAVTVRAWAAVFAALGGVLVSWSAGVAYSREQAVAEIEDRLLSFSRQLGTEASNIRLAVDGAQRGSFSAETCLALLSQSLNSITNIVAEIQAQLGYEFDPQGLIATREKLDQLTRELDKDEVPTKDELETIRESLADMSQALTAATAAPTLLGALNRVVREPVECPYCARRNQVDIGAHAGATSVLRCTHCNGRANVHRSATGALFTRRVAGGAASGPYDESCPECDAPIPIRIRGDGRPQKVVCTACAGSFDFDPGQRSLTLRGRLRPAEAAVAATRGNRPLVNCPGCGVQLMALVPRGDDRYAICGPCELLLHVPAAEFRAWKEAQSEATPLPV